MAHLAAAPSRRRTFGATPTADYHLADGPDGVVLVGPDGPIAGTANIVTITGSTGATATIAGIATTGSTSPTASATKSGISTGPTSRARFTSPRTGTAIRCICSR